MDKKPFREMYSLDIWGSLCFKIKLNDPLNPSVWLNIIIDN